MKSRFNIVMLLTVVLVSAAISQTNDAVINRHGGKGKKNGYYIQFLDKYLNPIDSASSYFYSYEYYDCNSPLFKFIKHKKANTALYPDSIQISRITKGCPILLTGFFRVLNQNILIAEYYFDTAGIIKYSKNYHAQYSKSKDIMKYGLEESILEIEKIVSKLLQRSRMFVAAGFITRRKWSEGTKPVCSDC